MDLVSFGAGLVVGFALLAVILIVAAPIVLRRKLGGSLPKLSDSPVQLVPVDDLDDDPSDGCIGCL